MWRNVAVAVAHRSSNAKCNYNRPAVTAPVHCVLKRRTARAGMTKRTSILLNSNGHCSPATACVRHIVQPQSPVATRSDSVLPPFFVPSLTPPTIHFPIRSFFSAQRRSDSSSHRCSSQQDHQRRWQRHRQHPQLRLSHQQQQWRSFASHQEKAKLKRLKQQKVKKKKRETGTSASSRRKSNRPDSEKQFIGGSMGSGGGRKMNMNPNHNTTGTAAHPSDFPLPDKDKELELGQFQSRVQDLFRQGNYRKGLKAAQELLQETDNHFGQNGKYKHPATAAAHVNVGLFHKLLGNFDDSRKHYQAAVDLYKATTGTDHASYAAALHNLAALYKDQVHLDTGLRPIDRLTLLEQAVQYFEVAHRIRAAEYGENHPRTVVSKSAWGACLAAQVLQSYKQTSTPGSMGSNSASNIGGNKEENTEAEAIKISYVSVLTADKTAGLEVGWEAAEMHLREALQTSVDHPRGPSIEATTNKKSEGGNDIDEEVYSHTGKILTLSAATASQNLAVFLKARATVQEDDRSSARLNEARALYTTVLAVRTELLSPSHPDVYATKHSLAELLDAMNENDRANQIRQEIVDTYDPPTAPSSETEENMMK